MGPIGFEEILLIMIVAVIVYGGDLPSAMRNAAKNYRKAKDYLNQAKEEFIKNIPPEVTEIRDEINKTTSEVSDEHKSNDESKPS